MTTMDTKSEQIAENHSSDGQAMFTRLAVAMPPNSTGDLKEVQAAFINSLSGWVERAKRFGLIVEFSPATPEATS